VGKLLIYQRSWPPDHGKLCQKIISALFQLQISWNSWKARTTSRWENVNGDRLSLSKSVNGARLCLSKNVNGARLCLYEKVNGATLCQSRSVNGAKLSCYKSVSASNIGVYKLCWWFLKVIDSWQTNLVGFIINTIIFIFSWDYFVLVAVYCNA
jgi:hypothetical protein